jgi:hypothetical protein
LPVTGFPDFEQFCIAGFPARTQIFGFKSVASTNFATPARVTKHNGGAAKRQGVSIGGSGSV